MSPFAQFPELVSFSHIGGLAEALKREARSDTVAELVDKRIDTAIGEIYKLLKSVCRDSEEFTINGRRVKKTDDFVSYALTVIPDGQDETRVERLDSEIHHPDFYYWSGQMSVIFRSVDGDLRLVDVIAGSVTKMSTFLMDRDDTTLKATIAA